MQEQQLLVDYENVQPSMDDLLKLAPKVTDVWLFHGPNQIKRAEQLKAAHERVTLVPHSGKGKNALDFHLTFYLGYVAAKHPDANLLVVANDKGYDSMLAHAKLLGFTATRVGFKVKRVKAAKKTAKSKKTTASKSPDVAAMDSAAGSLAVAASTTPQTEAKAGAAKKAESVKSPAKKVAAKKANAKKAVVKKEPASSVASKVPPPAKKAVTKKATLKKKTTAAKVTPAEKVASPKPVSTPVDKLLARARTSLAKMGKNRPTKRASLLRHLKSQIGQAATADEAAALCRKLEAAKVIEVNGDLVTYL